MNNDLISREALKKAINTYDTFACLPDGKLYPVRELEHPEMFVTYIHVEDVIKAIDNAPTVTPDKIQAIMSDYLVYRCETQRPQGEWLSRSHGTGINYGRECSLCGKVVEFSENFCPNCGADMRKGGKRKVI